MFIHTDAPFLIFTAGHIVTDDFALVLPVFAPGSKNYIILELFAYFLEPGMVPGIAYEDCVKAEGDMVLQPFLDIQTVPVLHL